MTFLPESELILNDDGSVYHLHLQPEQLAPTVITVGDPDRVGSVSQHFDRIDHKIQKREFITHTGELNGKRLTVISTGIGTDNIDIVLNELDALVNIDFKTRQIKAETQALDIIRIGTSGCLQPDIPVDSMLISTFALGLDGLMHYYDYANNANETMLQFVFSRALQGRMNLPIRPYLIEGSPDWVTRLGYDMQKGMTVTCPGFYAPQGRQLRAEIQSPGLLDALQSFEHDGLRITNFEMETAGIYGLARLLGHRAISCNALLANRANGTFSPHPAKTVNKLIEIVLERITQA